MKTYVMEAMPDLFWQRIKENNWQKYFVENAESAEIVIVRTKTIFNQSLFEIFPDLKIIIRAGTGIDNIDLANADRRNIKVFNTPEANAHAAFEHTLSFILALIKHHEMSKNAVLSGSWKNDLPANWEIADLKALIIGVGRVGTKVGRILLSLGAEVKGVDPYLSDEQWEERNIPAITYDSGLKWCNLLSFHCPLTEETRHYFSLQTLDKLINPIWLINTARGGIVQEKAISEGLRKYKLLGVALDVFKKEPWHLKDFSKNNNVILSPHTGSFTKRAKNRMSLEALQVWKDLIFDY